MAKSITSFKLYNKGETVMNKLATLIANGEISVQELASGYELIERARLVTDGINACKKMINFPLGVNSVTCYRYTDSFGEYEAWADCTPDGTVTFYCNWGGNRQIAQLNITNYSDVFLGFENSELNGDLARFLKRKIEESKTSHYRVEEAEK